MSDNNKIRLILVSGGKVVKDSVRVGKWYPFGNFAGAVLDIRHNGTRATARTVPETTYRPDENHPYVVYDLDKGLQARSWEYPEVEALLNPPEPVAPRTPNPFAPLILTALMRANDKGYGYTVHAGMPSTARVQL